MESQSYSHKSKIHERYEELTEVILPKSRISQLATQKLYILWSGPEKANRFKMIHGFSWLGNGVYQFNQKDFFLKKFRLWVHHTDNTNLKSKKITIEVDHYDVNVPSSPQTPIAPFPKLFHREGPILAWLQRMIPCRQFYIMTTYLFNNHIRRCKSGFRKCKS